MSIKQQYEQLLKSKASYGSDNGFEPIYLPPTLFDFQVSLTEWAIRKGRAAIFADCGMGKTIIQLVWADNVVRKTNKPVLILTPLAVSQQTISEAEKFGIEAYPAQGSPQGANIRVVNYERLHYFDSSDYAGIVCDESSILKNFNGTRKAQITEFMRQIKYRLLCTATAAPNDWEELGTSSEALGYLGHMDMLAKFFTTKNRASSSRNNRQHHDKFYLREYAKVDFWRWVGSWSRAARKPSDLGFDDNGFILPKLIENDYQIEGTKAPDMLWDMEATNFFEERAAINRTINERCQAAAELVNGHNTSIVWCHLNDEAKTLKRIIPGAVEVSGGDSPERKEEVARWFVDGRAEKKILITKPKIFGFGMNFQNCDHSVYFPTHSYEAYYQATRRMWRFGQTNPVTIDRVYTNGGKRMLQNLRRKSRQADKMFESLVANVNDAISIENIYEKQGVKIPKWLTK